MNIVLMVAILASSAIPVHAQDQPDVAKLKADAQNVVKIISGDKQKVQIYCEISKLSDQADDEEDVEKAEEMRGKAGKLKEALGPEFIALVGRLKDADPNSQDTEEIGLILNSLDDLCGD